MCLCNAFFILQSYLSSHFLICTRFPLLLTFTEYPWSITTETEKTLVKWLFLPSYFEPPEASKLYSKFYTHKKNSYGNCFHLYNIRWSYIWFVHSFVNNFVSLFQILCILYKVYKYFQYTCTNTHH